MNPDDVNKLEGAAKVQVPVEVGPGGSATGRLLHGSAASLRITRDRSLNLLLISAPNKLLGAFRLGRLIRVHTPTLLAALRGEAIPEVQTTANSDPAKPIDSVSITNNCEGAKKYEPY